MPAGPSGLSQQRREAQHPPVDGDVVDLDPALGEQLFDVAVGQAEAQVPPDRQHDHIRREAEPGEGGARGDRRAGAVSGSHGRSVSARTTSRPTQQSLTDQAATYPVGLEELLPAAWHRTDRYANNGIECDHGRLKARLGPMRGLKQDRSARVVIAGHGFVQNLQRGHYELAVEEPVNQRMAVAFDELALAI